MVVLNAYLANIKGKQKEVAILGLLSKKILYSKKPFNSAAIQNLLNPIYIMQNGRSISNN